jgi:hypothetical protein
MLNAKLAHRLLGLSLLAIILFFGVAPFTGLSYDTAAKLLAVVLAPVVLYVAVLIVTELWSLVVHGESRRRSG